MRDLKNITSDIVSYYESDNFLHYGMGVMAYVRPVPMQGRTLYAVNRADGQTLAMFDTLELACKSIHSNDMVSMLVQ